ncbi:MAG: HD domain-containing protein [Deltaproteobacteria bacterium]|nr:HD domain-containing protein [Deltaproteobacteria bacterium]
MTSANSQTVTHSSVSNITLLPVALESIPLDKTLDYPLYILVAGQQILFRKTGDILTNERAFSLNEKHVDTLYIPESAWSAYSTALESQQPAASQDECSENSIQNLRNALLMFCERLSELNEPPTRKSLSQMRETAHRLAALIRHRPSIANDLLRRYSDTSLYYANHGINVAIYSASIGNKLAMSASDLSCLTFAAMVHDIGINFLPKTLLAKATHSQQEIELVRNHTINGAELLDSTIAIKEVTLTALQHHERMDGTGYPNKIAGSHIHLFARICAIANIYDNLTSPRPNHPQPFSPQAGVRMMQYMSGCLDPTLFPMLLIGNE